MVWSVALVLAIAIALPAPALAQSPPSTQPGSELPVSLVRIKRALSEQQSSKTMDGLKISYYVSVTAEPPPINLFKDFDVNTGKERFSGAPTHAELLAQMTPQEFSAPVADFTGIAVWLGTAIYKKARH